MDDLFDQSEKSMPHIGDYAPAFRSVTTQGTIYFPADYFGKWVILFSYPKDCTPVSIFELNALASMHEDFKKLNCAMLGLSVGQYSRPTHNIVRKEIEYKGTKNVEIKFPVIEDITTELARKYGIIQPGKRNSKTVHSVFIINPECMIKGVINYPMSLGLNLDELKKVIIGLQIVDKKGIKTHPDMRSDNEKKITGNYFN